MKYTHRQKGVCSSTVDFEIEDNIVKNVKFTGGCNGNLQAVAALVEGMPVEEVCKRLEGIRCGFKKTSCSDQFVQGLKEATAAK